MKSMSPLTLALMLAVSLTSPSWGAEKSTDALLKKIGTERGIVGFVELPDGGPAQLLDLAKSSELTIYVQTSDARQLHDLRQTADAAGLLGVQIFAVQSSPDALQLADNVADCIVVNQAAEGAVKERELLRALRPKAIAYIGQIELVKPIPKGIDEWTHPYHAPDNNPQSTDQLAQGHFHTQFLAEPKFSPMPEQSVIAGGRIFKALGHIAHKANQNEMLNALLCINAYNGTVLWKRPLPEGFMIHRNTMIGTDDALYMGDDQSCKIIDAVTGKVRDEITVGNDISDGPVWKWMAMQDGILYALVGSTEVKVDVQKSARRGLGHWPWGMWKGHDYSDPSTAFGFGRTLVAIDPKTKKVLWHFRDKEFLDARGVAMRGDRLFVYAPGKYLAALDTKTGKLAWKNTDKDLHEAIGPDERAQHYVTGYATTCFMKCNDDYLFFSGPQRSKMVVASAKDGSLAWTHKNGNLQLVLRQDAIYAAGPGTTGLRLNYDTGETLGTLPTRRACTRATGCVDSVFYRTSGGTVRVITGTNTAEHIAPMRPPCQDGVLVSNGHLYWGPWMCGCQLSLYGNIGLGPAQPLPSTGDLYRDALTMASEQPVVSLNAKSGDWNTYRGSNARNDVAKVAISDNVEPAWTADICSTALPTAPVIAGGKVFIADRTGAVAALDEQGKLLWKAYTAGPVYYSPAVAHDRVYVGSADGRVYAFEAVTGRLLWTFRVAPQDRLIPIFGSLISRWPVAGGVAVHDGTLYAAAGITHYDGTYVVAIDAITGKLKAKNTTSGALSADVNSGISMQGNLGIAEGELRFLAGGVYETARYHLETLECLNEPTSAVTSQFRTAFYPYYPNYGKYVSLEHEREDGCVLCHDASYEGSVFTNLALESALPPGTPRDPKEAARWIRRGGGAATPKHVWQDKQNRRFTGFVITDKSLLTTGHPDEQPERPFLAAVNVNDGSDVWKVNLPAIAVKGGLAVDSQGRIYAALENGKLVCYRPKR